MPCNSRWLAIITVVGTGVGMAIWTWGTWPDPITDFGKEVYIAWQLSQGKRLYVDVAYHLGVLSPYFNALIFKIFGASLASIEWVDLGLIAAIAVLLFRLIDRIAGLLAATVTGVVFFTLFAFGHFTPIADYNYVCPYDYEHTHGLLLGLVGLTAAGHYNRTGRLWAIVLAGAAVGLAFLTRAELFVAAGAGVGVSLIPSAEMPLTLALSRSTGRLSSPQAGRGDWGKIGGLFLAGILLPILSAWGLLAVALPAPIAWRGILGSWPVVFDRSVAGNRFYRESMGTLNAGESLWRMARWGCYWLLLVGVPLVGWGIKRNAYLWMALAFIWGAGVACVAGHFEDPAEAFSPLPLAVVGCLILAWKLGGPRRGVSMGVVVWGFVLLGKICLNARIYQYGFVLAMPATVIVVIGGISWLPELIGRR